MIRFPCHCKTVLQVPDDEAGGVIQCTKCGRLNDIPTLSDLQSITEDGTYKIETPQDKAELDRLAQLQRSFAKQRVDDAGEDIDLRMSIDDMIESGRNIAPVSQREELRPSAPKYDPVTGELVRAIDIAKDPEMDPNSIPMAKAVVNYAVADTQRQGSYATIFLN